MHAIGRIARRGLELLLDPAALVALATWPKFSLTSYKMVSALVQQGILPATVIDVGANAGQFTIAATKLFPGCQVHSFEPLPDCVERLRHNARKLSNITVYALALGDTEQESVLHRNSYSLSSSFLDLAETHREAFPAGREVEAIRVRVSTIDKVLGSADLTPPVLLKLDVQGFEASVVRGAGKTLKEVDYVLLEASLKRMYEGEMMFVDLLNLMEDSGFRFLRPVGWLSHPKTDEILQMDALFQRNNLWNVDGAQDPRQPVEDRR